jgi:hypothetical protein
MQNSNTLTLYFKSSKLSKPPSTQPESSSLEKSNESKSKIPEMEEESKDPISKQMTSSAH